MSSLWTLSLLLPTFQTANLENQCFDSDPLGYCSELDTSSATITSLLHEMQHVAQNYVFRPYGVVYNVSVINTSNDSHFSSVYLIGTHELTSTSQLQWDISSFFMQLFLDNTTQHKHILVDTEYDGLNFGLRIYDYIMANNASKYRAYIQEMYDAASSPIQDWPAFLQLVNSNSLQHKLSIAQYYGLTLRNAMSSEIQESIQQYIQLFKYTRNEHRYRLQVKSLESTQSAWDLWLHGQIQHRDKLYKQQYQALFQKYFDLIDSLLTYSYWYQDSNLYDTLFRWKQKSYYIFQRWLFRSRCVQIERDNFWIANIAQSVLNECRMDSGEGEESTKCQNIVVTETYHIERIVEKLESELNEVLNTNAIKLDVHRVKVDWLSHVDETRDQQAIAAAVRETVGAFIEDLQLFVSWQAQT